MVLAWACQLYIVQSISKYKKVKTLLGSKSFLQSLDRLRKCARLKIHYGAKESTTTVSIEVYPMVVGAAGHAAFAIHFAKVEKRSPERIRNYLVNSHGPRKNTRSLGRG